MFLWSMDLGTLLFALSDCAYRLSYSSHIQGNNLRSSLRLIIFCGATAQLGPSPPYS